MYRLKVSFQDGSTFDSSMNERQLTSILHYGLKGIVKWATVITPSGVSKDVTRNLQII